MLRYKPVFSKKPVCSIYQNKNYNFMKRKVGSFCDQNLPAAILDKNFHLLSSGFPTISNLLNSFKC